MGFIVDKTISVGDIVELHFHEPCRPYAEDFTDAEQFSDALNDYYKCIRKFNLQDRPWIGIPVEVFSINSDGAIEVTRGTTIHNIKTVSVNDICKKRISR